MTTHFSTIEVRNAVGLLASRSLIRLITEIDDNGAIPPRRLTGTFPDLSSHQLRRATEAACAYALVRTAPGSSLELTDSGADLADLYDAAARWARRHAYPAPVCKFSSRIRHVLDLLAPSLADKNSDIGPWPSGARASSIEADLARPRALLIEWLAGNPQVTRVAYPDLVA
ncbi:regulator [Streptomyces sp. NPDC096323]|uniref:regulator n=1 Tax=Streptomyces sp. NPDC096323 TaxID=3155822 RepID=UPI0033167E38